MVDQLYSQIVWNVFRNNEFYRLRMKCDFVHFWGLTASNRMKRIFLPRSSELAPTSDIAVFTGALNLHNEFFHQPRLVPVFFPEMMFANVRRLFLPIFGS